MPVNDGVIADLAAELSDRIEIHRQNGRNTRAVNFCIQSSSLSLAFSGLYMAPFLAPGVFLMSIGLAGYGLSVAAQSKNIGYIKPIPGLPYSLNQVAYCAGRALASLLGKASPDRPDAPPPLSDFSYLGPRERRELVICQETPRQFLQLVQAGATCAKDVDRLFVRSVDALQQMPDSLLLNPQHRFLPETQTYMEVLTAQNQGEWERLKESATNEVMDARIIESEPVTPMPIPPKQIEPADDTSAVAFKKPELPTVSDFLGKTPTLKIEPDPWTPPAKKETEGKIQRTAFSEILKNPFQSRAVFGAQRTGKSLLVAAIGRELSERGTSVYHLNLLSYSNDKKNEDAEYTQHCKDSVTGDLSRLHEDEASDLIQEAISVVEEWWNDKSASILAVDEWAYLSDKSGQYAALLQSLLGLIAGKISALTSSGIKRNKAVYAIMPQIVASQWLPQGLCAKQMKLCYVSIPPNKFVDWQGQSISFNQELFQQVKNNYSIEPPTMGNYPSAERIAYVNGRWLDVGVTPAMVGGKK